MKKLAIIVALSALLGVTIGTTPASSLAYEIPIPIDSPILLNNDKAL